MLNQRWKHILHREMIVFFICLAIGLSLAIMGRIIGGDNNSGSIFYFAIVFFFSLLYFFVQSIRAISWSILNIMRH
ncbi:MAG: hypothetical protein ACMUIU_12865 [bacterium]